MCPLPGYPPKKGSCSDHGRGQLEVLAPDPSNQFMPGQPHHGTSIPQGHVNNTES